MDFKVNDDEARMARSRTKILATKTAVDSIDYFGREQDSIGYELALERFAKEENVSKEVLLQYVKDMF